MAWIHVRYRVADVKRWVRVFDETTEYKQKHGWRRFFVFTVEGNRNDVMVMEEFDTREHAQEFLNSTYLREAMTRAGVSGAPETFVLDELAEGTY